MIFLCNRITWRCCNVGPCNCKTDFGCSIWLYWVYNKTMVKSQVLYIVCIPNYLAAFLFKCLWANSIRIYRVVTLFWFLEHLRGAYLECTACSDGYKKEQHQVHGFLLLYRRKKKVLQKYLLCKLFILMPRVKTISTKWKNPATSFLGVKVSWERVLNSYLQITQIFQEV